MGGAPVVACGVKYGVGHYIKVATYNETTYPELPDFFNYFVEKGYLFNIWGIKCDYGIRAMIKEPLG